MTTRKRSRRKNESEKPAQVPVYSRAVIYARVSSETQAKDGHGLDAQETRCRSHAERKGYHVERVFKDAYTGAGDFMQRPAMGALLAYLDERPHENYVVIFDDLKRFARDVGAHLKLRTAFKIRGVLLESPNYTFDDSPEGEFVEIIMAGQAQLERKQNKRQVVQKMKARLENGYWTFGSKKGYDMVKNPLHGMFAVPNKEGQILKEALEAFAAGKLLRKIDACRFLVERGFWRKQLPDRYLEKLEGLMKDPFYCGDISYPRWDVARRKAKHDGIISPDTFDRIQKRLQSAYVKNYQRVDISDDFPLRGLLICSGCGKHLTGAWARGRSKRYAYYFCQNKGCEIHLVMLSRDEASKDFKALLKRNRLKPNAETLAVVIFERVWKQEIGEVDKYRNAAESRATELREEIKDLTRAVRAAADKSPLLQRVYESQIEEAAHELENLEGSLVHKLDTETPYQTALEKATGVLKNPVSIWDIVDAVEKRRLFFFLFEAKLAYAKKAGYQTAESLSTTRLFEEFVDTNPLDVEVSLERLNRLKDYLARFWVYYRASPALQKALQTAYE